MNAASLSNLHRCALSVLAGALAALCFNPLNFWLLGPLAVALLYVVVASSSLRQASWYGWLFGLGYFGVGTSWIYVSINQYGNAGTLLSVLITVLFVVMLALFCALQTWSFKKYAAGHLPFLGFTATWVLVEWLRGWLFTGFPWLYVGSAHVTTLFSGIAPVFGVFGISFALVLSGALVGELILRCNKPVSLPALFKTQLPTALVLIWMLAFASGQLEWVQPRDEALTVGIVQGNIAQSVKFQADALQQSLDTYDILSAPLWESDLVVWPETAIPMAYQNAGRVLDYFTAQANDYNSTLITGIFWAKDNEIHNSITALGAGSGIWHKQKLVPFGEYVPFRSLLSNLLQLFALPMSSLSPGPRQQELLKVGEFQVATFICYEVVYPDFVREFGRDADFLLTISNDTWFGASWGPWQHLQIAAMRALELGRYMVRATNDGVSALIDERGNILAQSAQFQEDTLQGKIQLFEGNTPFARWGSTPVLLLSLFLFLMNLYPFRRRDAAAGMPPGKQPLKR
jgi:apolipoprotein N-acyltransferase